ncbi:MAG TPA: hypothetical protein VJY33_05505 [Isosphaeraceae bacterium]|nr:hypothetical protein [Isosphaeraceae bacterium]
MSEQQPAQHPQTYISLDELRERQPRFSWKVWLVWFAVVTVLFIVAFLFYLLFHPEVREKSPWLAWLVVLVMLAPVYGMLAAPMYCGYVWLRRSAYRFMLKGVAAESIEKRTEILQDDLEKDFFNNLVKINFKYIDKYYLQTQIQADKAFTMCVVAAFIGFAVVIAGVVQMYIGKLQPAYVTTVAGVLSQFIAAVFFYLYNKTMLKMAEYHRKLVLTQNIGLALRITQDLPEEQRLVSQSALVDRLSTDINALLASNAK